MSLTTLDSIVAASRQKLTFQKASATTKGGNYYHSLWMTGGLPAAGNQPPSGVGEVPTKATQGALGFTELGAGNSIYLGRVSAQIANNGTLIFYDRLCHTSGLSGILTTEQTVNSSALTRYSDGVGVEVWLETYSPTGATGVNITVKYTDQNGATGQTVTMAHQASPVAGQLQQVVPIFGCRQVESVTFSGTTGSAGNFGITLAKRLFEIPLIAAQGSVLGPFTIGLPQVVSNACLAMMILASGTASGVMNGCSIDLLQG